MAQITIQPGQTLSGIAKQNKTTVSELLRLNPSITNPNLIRAGANLLIPETQFNPTPVPTPANPTPTPTPPSPITPPKNPNENVDLSRSGRYLIDQTNNIDLYDTQSGTKLDPTTAQSLGLNEKFIPRGDVTKYKTGGQATIENEQPTVASVLKDLGLAYPDLVNTDELTKAQLEKEDAAKKLKEFEAKLRSELVRIEDNPFLISSEILGEKRRVTTDNQTMLQTLIDNANSANERYNTLEQRQSTQSNQRLQFTNLALSEIERRGDDAYKKLQDSEKSKADQDSFDVTVQRLRLDTPEGQTFTVGGKSYTGLKKPTSDRATTTKAEERDSAVSQFLSEKKGNDGYVAAEVYQQALKKFIAGGGTQSNFFASFPQQTYLRQLEIEKLPAGMRPQQVTDKGNLTPDQVALINDAKAAIDFVKQSYGDVNAARQQIIEESKSKYGFDPGPYF